MIPRHAGLERVQWGFDMLWVLPSRFWETVLSAGEAPGRKRRTQGRLGESNADSD